MTATSKDAVLLSIRRRPRIQGMGDVAGKSRESLTLVKSLPFVLRARSFNRTRFERACVTGSSKGEGVEKLRHSM
jgi:hypothetical protein